MATCHGRGRPLRLQRARVVLRRVAIHRLIVVALVTLFLAPAAAVSQEPAPGSPPACPAPSLAYEGVDDVVREVRMLRDEQRATCLAARHDANEAQADADRAHADALDAQADADVAHADSVALLAAVEELGADDPTAQTVALALPDRERLDALIVGAGLTAGLLIAGLLLAPAVRRYWT